MDDIQIFKSIVNFVVLLLNSNTNSCYFKELKKNNTSKCIQFKMLLECQKNNE